MTLLRADRLRRFIQSDIYPVTSAALSKGRDSLDILDGILAGGAQVVQLREKTLDKRSLYALALAFRERCNQAKALLIVNDHLDIALAVEADGLHLGQDDLPLGAARALAPDLLICASTHNAEEIERAQREGADIINIGPIYPTATKEHDKVLGLAGLRELAPLATVPFSVMGGIKQDKLAELVKAGALHPAVVTAITQADDPAEATRRLIATHRQAREETTGA